MAVQYVTKQDKRKNGSNLWYGRAIHPATIDLDALAERIEHTCSMTKGDVKAVLIEMVSAMKIELQNSNKVKIDGLGTFSISLRTSGSASEDKFTAKDNIKAFVLNFLAEGKVSNGKLTRACTDGIKAVKAV